jgi:hypothetical protein
MSIAADATLIYTLDTSTPSVSAIASRKVSLSPSVRVSTVNPEWVIVKLLVYWSAAVSVSAAMLVSASAAREGIPPSVLPVASLEVVVPSTEPRAVMSSAASVLGAAVGTRYWVAIVHKPSSRTDSPGEVSALLGEAVSALLGEAVTTTVERSGAVLGGAVMGRASGAVMG